MQCPGAMGLWCDLVPDLSDKWHCVFPSDHLRSCKCGPTLEQYSPRATILSSVSVKPSEELSLATHSTITEFLSLHGATPLSQLVFGKESTCWCIYFGSPLFT